MIGLFFGLHRLGLFACSMSFSVKANSCHVFSTNAEPEYIG